MTIVPRSPSLPVATPGLIVRFESAGMSQSERTWIEQCAGQRVERMPLPVLDYWRERHADAQKSLRSQAPAVQGSNGQAKPDGKGLTWWGVVVEAFRVARAAERERDEESARNAPKVVIEKCTRRHADDEEDDEEPRRVLREKDFESGYWPR